jgi:hypothetical protein
MDIVNILRAQWDRALSVAIGLTAGLLLLLGYRGVSGTPHVAAQLPYIVSAGLFGIFLLTIAATLWVSADLRDEWRELRALRVRLDHGMATRQAEPAGSVKAVQAAERTGSIGLPALEVSS